MRFAKQSKGKKNIAVLLVVAMLLTIMPVAAFAVDEEGWGVTITPSVTEVTTGSTVTFEATATTSSAVVWSSTGGIVTPGETTVDENGVTSSSADVYFDAAGNYTVTAAFTADEDGTVKEAVSNVKVTVPKEPAVVTPEMTQEEIQAAIDENDEIVFEAGQYEYNLNLTIDGKKTLHTNGIVEFTGDKTTPSDEKNILFNISANSELIIASGEWNINGYCRTISIEDAKMNVFDSKLSISEAAFPAAVWIHGDGASEFNAVNSQINFSNNTADAIWIADNGTTAKVKLNFEKCDTVLNQNGVSRNGHGIWNQGQVETQIDIVINGGNFEANENGWGGITLVNNRDFIDSLTIKGKANVNLNENGAYGYNNGHLYVLEESVVNANENKIKDGIAASRNFHVSGKSSVTAINNGLSGTPEDYDGCGVWAYQVQITEESTVNASGNQGAGIFFGYDGDHYIKDSTVIADNNYVNLYDCYDTTVENSFVSGMNGSRSALGYDYRYDFFGQEFLKKNNVIRLSGVATDKVDRDISGYLISEYYQETYMRGGSLQAERDEMTGEYKLNGYKAPEDVYAAPINRNKGTMLTRFNLNAEKNAEVGLTAEDTAKTSKAFTYYDPNKKDSKYDYEFRYNVAGEDLVEGESGNAYVWAPVSILHYDATEGRIANTVDATKANNSTAYIGNVALINTRGDGSAVGNQGNAMQADNRYATDYTIYGNSMQLSEAVMPQEVSRDGYAFAGWFVADDEAEAEKLAAAGNFTELYKLLNTEFTPASKVATDLNDVSKAQEEKTIYAKWTKGKIDGTVFEDGTRNDALDENEFKFEEINVKLLKDGNVIATTTTDANGYYKFVDVDFGKYTVEIEWPEKNNDAMDNICAVNAKSEAGNKFTAGTDKKIAVSKEVEISKDNLEATLNAGFYNTTGGGGTITPNPDPEPPTTDPEKPPVEIPDPDVPLVEPEDPTTEIDEPDVPLIDVPGTPVEEIDEPEVPLGDAPKTGDAAPIVGLIGLLVVAVAGLVVVRRKFN